MKQYAANKQEQFMKLALIVLGIIMVGFLFTLMKYDGYVLVPESSIKEVKTENEITSKDDLTEVQKELDKTNLNQVDSELQKLNGMTF